MNNIEPQFSQSFRFRFEVDEEFMELLAQLSSRPGFDWTFFSTELSGSGELIAEVFRIYRDRIDFKALSSNFHIEWDQSLTRNVAERLDWGIFSCNPALKLTFNFLLHYRDNWHWKNQFKYHRKYWGWREDCLSKNPALLLDPIVMHEFEQELDWRGVGLNHSLWAREELYLPYDGDTDYDEYEFRRNIGLLLEFKHKWKYDRSTAGDDNECFCYTQKTSIFDNTRIDWKLPQLAEAFADELAEFQTKYRGAE